MDLLAHGRGRLVAEHPGHGRVDPDHAALGRALVHAVDRVLEDVAVAALGAQGGLVPLGQAGGGLVEALGQAAQLAGQGLVHAGLQVAGGQGREAVLDPGQGPQEQEPEEKHDHGQGRGQEGQGDEPDLRVQGVHGPDHGPARAHQGAEDSAFRHELAEAPARAGDGVMEGHPGVPVQGDQGLAAGAAADVPGQGAHLRVGGIPQAQAQALARDQVAQAALGQAQAGQVLGPRGEDLALGAHQQGEFVREAGGGHVPVQGHGRMGLAEDVGRDGGQGQVHSGHPEKAADLGVHRGHHGHQGLGPGLPGKDPGPAGLASRALAGLGQTVIGLVAGIVLQGPGQDHGVAGGHPGKARGAHEPEARTELLVGQEAFQQGLHVAQGAQAALGLRGGRGPAPEDGRGPARLPVREPAAGLGPQAQGDLGPVEALGGVVQEESGLDRHGLDQGFELEEQGVEVVGLVLGGPGQEQGGLAAHGLLALARERLVQVREPGMHRAADAGQGPGQDQGQGQGKRQAQALAEPVAHLSSGSVAREPDGPSGGSG